MFSDDIMNAEIYNFTSKIDEVNQMMNPVIMRIEEHRNRDELYKVTLERFANYTKEVRAI